MPVSENKEPGVLARQSSSVSAGIPLKKRRFHLVQPTSPPQQEIPPAPHGDNDVKKNEDSSSNMSNKEESKEECQSDVKSKEEYKEESHSDLKSKEEYSSDMNDKEESCSELKIKEVSESDLNEKAGFGTDLMTKEDSNSDQGSGSADVAEGSLGLPDTCKNSLIEVKKEGVSDPHAISDPNANLLSSVDLSGSVLPECSQMVKMVPVSSLESRTKLLLAEKSASPEFSGTATVTKGAHVVGVKKEIHNKLVDEDFELKLLTASANKELSLGPKTKHLSPGHVIEDAERNSAMHDKLDTSLLALSLSKGKTNNVEEKNKDAISGSNTSNYASTNRSKWDLNTTMDDWEGSAIDGTSQGAIDATSKKISLDVAQPSLGSIVSDTACNSKGKQIIATDEHRPISSTSFVPQEHQSADTTLSLTLSTFNHSSSAKQASSMDVPNSDVVIDSAVSGMVKTEPIYENSKNQGIGASGNHSRLVDVSSVKSEPVERNNIEAVTSANSSEKLVAQIPIKSEQAADVFVGTCKKGEVISQPSVAKFVHSQGSASSSLLPSTPQKCSPSRFITSSELSASIEVSNQSELSVHTKEVDKGKDAGVHDVASDMIYKPLHKSRGAEVSDHKLDDNVPNMNRSERTNEISHDSHANREGSVSDEEKINISTEMMEDECYGSECESDGDQTVENRLDPPGRCVRDDDEYEDGEVREPPRHSMVEEPILERMDTENMKVDDHDTTAGPVCGFASVSGADKFVQGESEVHGDKTIECIKECVGKTSNENDEQLTDKDNSLQKLLPDAVAVEKLLPNTSRKKSLDQSGKNNAPEGNQKDIACDGTTSSSHGAETKIESSVNANDATAKDSISGGSKSRIINLPRGTVTSPGRVRSIADRSLLSRSGRYRYSDIEGEKFLLHRNREEIDTDSPQRFIREKIYDQPYRSSRPYGRGRGRFSGRLDNSRGDWYTEREFGLESYTNDYRFSRNKRASAVADAELESNEFVVTPDGSTLNTGRGRKPLNDDLATFRQLGSRRLSPGGRDGSTTRDIRMLRRIPRNISPCRRSDENGSDLVGLQHDEKLVRSLPDEMIDPAYSRSQPLYESGTGQFGRGNRNFSTVQRRGFARVRSKSPVGSRARSPGPWSPPRRRSPDGFGGLSQLSQHRAAPLYGIERIRSPDRSCFPEDMVTRRRGSPSFMSRPSNDMRDIEPGREHGHGRPMNPSRRSPSDRVFGRSSRRLDVSDPRIGAGEDEYFGRPVHSNRFHEFHGDGGNDERRKCSERRGLVRSFRPSYIGDGDNLRFHLDDGPRPFRFCPEGDTDFGGRTMRERDFDGRIKNRQLVAPRRIRSMEEQGGNYRHSGQVWHDDGFNEAPGFKRRRF